MPANLQIIGICRFSYVAQGGFQKDHATFAEREVYLYDAERMERRFRGFEQICLRTISQQTDPDFRFLVITGTSLPPPYLERLTDLTASVPQVELIQHRPMNHRKAMEEIVNARIDQKGPPVMQFRLDDDDGVGCKYIERSREIFAEMRGLWDKHKRLAVDFNRGYLMRLDPQGLQAELTMRPNVCAAQALFLEPENRRTALHFPHHRIRSLMPVLSLTHVPMWIRSFDGYNDSARGLEDDTGGLSDEDRTQIEKRFGIDFGAIERSF